MIEISNRNLSASRGAAKARAAAGADGRRAAPIVYAPGLDEETVGQAVLDAARVAVHKRLRWKRNLGLSRREFIQEVARCIVAKVARFIPMRRKNGRMMRLEEYAYVAACFAILDILKARKKRFNAGRVDALDAPNFGLGAVVNYDEEFQGKSLRAVA